MKAKYFPLRFGLSYLNLKNLCIYEVYVSQQRFIDENMMESFFPIHCVRFRLDFHSIIRCLVESNSYQKIDRSIYSVYLSFGSLKRKTLKLLQFTSHHNSWWRHVSRWDSFWDDKRQKRKRVLSNSSMWKIKCVNNKNYGVQM